MAFHVNRLATLSKSPILNNWQGFKYACRSKHVEGSKCKQIKKTQMRESYFFAGWQSILKM